MSTPSIPTEERRKELAEEGKETIQVLVERMNVPHIAEQMKNLEAYNQEIAKRCPWVPFCAVEWIEQDKFSSSFACPHSESIVRYLQRS